MSNTIQIATIELINSKGIQDKFQDKIEGNTFDQEDFT